MKKFLTFLIVLIVTFTFGLIIFRLVRNEETISINATNAYYNEGETISFSYSLKNKNRTSKITVESSNSNVVAKQPNGEFKAVGGGVCQIILTHKNPKGAITTLAKDVSVGNGEEKTPYFVRNKDEFLNIFKAETQEELNQKLSKHYIQTTNITLTENFTPVDGVLTGSYRGMLLDDSTNLISFKTYSKIINYTVATNEGENKDFSAMFKEIGATGKFGYITFENVNINGSFDNASVVCKTNKGLIDFVSITGTVNNTNAGDSRTAGVAIENVYSVLNKQNEDGTTTSENVAANIIRSKNSAQISTDGNKLAGIVYRNNANVLFCVNASADGTMELDHAKLTAKGVSAIVGGIVGENYYGFGDDLKNEIAKIEGSDGEMTDELTTALSRRPQVKDCYSTSTIDIANSGIESVGGVIGKDIQGYNSDNETYKQVYANLTLGNYYLVVDENKFDSGVGNLKYTKYKEGQIYSSGTPFVALGLTASQLTSGIETDMGSEGETETVRASFISYYQDTTRVTWNDEGVYAFYKIDGDDYPPILKQTENYFGGLNYRMPTAFVKGGEINNLDDFLNIDFTEKTAAGNIKQFTITGWIDFGEISASRVGDYYTKKGFSGDNAAQFVLRGTETGEVDANGKPIYYGFKNISQNTLFTGNTDYMGIFGFVKNSIIENISFVNCDFQAKDESENTTATKAIGLVAGHAEATSINNITFVLNEEGGNGVNIEAKTAAAGGVVGELVDSSINGIWGVLAINGISSVELAYAGGVVGTSSNSNFKNIDCVVEVSASNIMLGGFGGNIALGEINNVKLDASVSNGASVGGFAHTMNNIKVSTINLTSMVEGTNVSAGVAVLSENYATFNNASVYTEFKSGAEQAGLFGTLRNTASASNVVFTNNFKNNIGRLYSKTINVTAQIFAGDGTIAGQRNVESGAGSLTNCFVRNLINDEQNYDKSKTVFYAEQRSAIDTTVNNVQKESFDPTIRNINNTILGFIPTQNVTVFGKYGAGILNENGMLINIEAKNKPFNVSLSNQQFGFSPEWNFDGFPTINF